MIETVDNAIQLLLTGIATCISLYFAVHLKGRAWILLSMFQGIYFLGDLYWFLYLLFYETTPPFSYISYISWYASFLFLLMLLLYVRQEKDMLHEGSEHLRWFLIVLMFTGGMCIFFSRFGDIFGNVVTAVLMTGLIWHAIDGLVFLKSEQPKEDRKMLYIVTLLFCFAEYAMWTASCFWIGDTIMNVYFWFDFLLSCTFVMFIPALRKAVGR